MPSPGVGFAIGFADRGHLLSKPKAFAHTGAETTTILGFRDPRTDTGYNAVRLVCGSVTGSLILPLAKKLVSICSRLTDVQPRFMRYLYSLAALR
jgi:hypothetical protein